MSRLEALEDCAKVLEHILTDVSLEWYVQQFAQTPAPGSSGTVAAIHNKELINRAGVAFERGRTALNYLKACTEETQND